MFRRVIREENEPGSRTLLSKRCVLSQRLSLRSTDKNKTKHRAAFEQMKEKQQQQTFDSK